MPHQARPSQSQSAEAAATTSYGQVIEYIAGEPPQYNGQHATTSPGRSLQFALHQQQQPISNMTILHYEDRLYLASYTHAPDETTPFPYPNKQSRSPSKRSARAQQGAQAASQSGLPPRYFTIDRSLLYNAFHADFGPLHIGHLYRFAVMLHDVLSQEDSDNRPVVFWSHADSRSRANAACILAVYMVLIQSWPPHLALAPIAQMDPPCMPFRDAGYSQADYSLTIQDVVYGVWKAKEEGLVGLKEFSLEEYERYERVDQGDFNWITPSFLAFASPQHKPTHIIKPSDPLYNTLPTSLSQLRRDKSLPTPFKNVLEHFTERDIGLVVRLNSELYSPSHFTALGIKHLDMIFDDGTCPPLNLVRKFINLAHNMIDRRKGIAVHCKAGLGRTGCLIGAYLIYRHGFTANEMIAFMRFMRPGMVVGPQQHWLHLNQGTFREWWYEDTMKEKLLSQMQMQQPTTPSRASQQSSRRLASNGQTFTPPPADRHAQTSPRRAALGEITNNEVATSQAPPPYTSSDELNRSLNGVSDENLPAPTPGQPRKTSKLYSSRKMMAENQPFDIKPESEVVTMQRSTHGVPADTSESEEEAALRGLLSSRKASHSPLSRSGKRRAISCTTTTTTTTKWDGLTDTSDAENRPALLDGEEAIMQDRMSSPTRPKTPKVRSGSGMAALSVGKRSSPSRRSQEGVRKTSGRVGSLNASRSTRAS